MDDLGITENLRLVACPPDMYFEKLSPEDIIMLHNLMPNEPWKDIGASNSGVNINDNHISVAITERPYAKAIDGEWLEFGKTMGLGVIWFNRRPTSFKDLNIHHFPKVSLVAILNEIHYHFEIEIFDQKELIRELAEKAKLNDIANELIIKQNDTI